MLGPVLGSQPPPAQQQPGAEGLEICTEGKALGVMVTAAEHEPRSAQECPGGLQHQGSDCHPVLGAAEATP